ncbi:type III secretion system effector phosphothreonine lyase (plasmid) [Escherichia albertii]|uniref:type III secretion system effector phosphothreonine lyase n=1 Tax=Escherichia albertii TaxID=208962 RepID=UPI0023613FA4|nr:type III secretion system effector phosphothreonine lyase [Escherichia albertii]WDC32317.1 type III secretion system effector phosphothreonine lyase [Escherichia albertii]WDC32318.1 type III secretion system effector phosphothreonine lyase [Escherichia albertii]WDC32319.1 type III secretion system effector phosphothreonine lyase [Escherichia albertii]WDC32320.1 type III secretion system effector phosphothreonine lyase [Escherichia albertii]
MPINRPNQQKLPPLHIESTYAGASRSSANEHLKNNFDTLHNNMRNMPVSCFKEAQGVPDYSGIRQIDYFDMSQGFLLNTDSSDVFIHACRDTPKNQGKFAGDKFHISVQRDMMPQAFQLLSGLLFSEDSPIDKWKVTNLERVDQQARVSVGAQFTLYIKPDQENSQYSSSLLHNIRDFIECLESRLSNNGIIPGQRPESDVHPENWQYFSYRNELRSERSGSEIQSQTLREEPFYRLMTE